MILIQIVLIVVILLMLTNFLASRNSHQTEAWKKILLMLFAVTAVVVVLFPRILDGVAHFFGVGRGADLLLYALVVAFIFERFNTYVKDKDDQKKLVKLARKIAILEASQRDK